MPRSVWCLSVLTPVSRSGTVFTCMCTESRVSLLSDLSCGKASIHSIAVTMWSSFLGVSCWQGVVINLRLDTAETQALGAELHVCELQLLLQPLAALLVHLREAGAS